MSVSAKRPFSREQRATIIQGMLIFVLIVVVLQLWLLTATMNAWLGGDGSNAISIGIDVGPAVFFGDLVVKSTGPAARAQADSPL